MKQSPSRASLRITGIYALFASAWIVFSDRFVEMLGIGMHAATQLATEKGLFFVLVTSGLLFVLIYRHAQALKNSEEIRRLTLASFPDGVIVVDAHHTLLEMNQAAADLVATKRNEDVREALMQFLSTLEIRDFDGENIPREAWATVRAFRGEIVKGMNEVVEGPDGREHYLRVSAAPIRFHKGKVTAVAAVLRDISDLKRLERLRDEFLSNAAHELKTPLAAIKTNIQLLQKLDARWDPEKKLRVLGLVDHQCDRMTRLIEELTEAALASAGRLPLKRSSFDLAELAASVVNEIAALGSHPITFRLQLGPERPGLIVNADRFRIERVMWSLLDNAVKFSKPGTEIVVELKKLVDRGPGDAQILIRDSGIGITEDEKLHIFEKYFRGQSAGPHEYGGMGLSLNLCRDIIREHGGDMSFTSQKGVGSTFAFTLPLPAGVELAGHDPEVDSGV